MWKTVLILVLVTFVVCVCEIASNDENDKIAFDLEMISAVKTRSIISGTCGTDVNFTFEDGLLTITGTGYMKNFSKCDAETPWAEFKASINRVVIEEGVKNIGSYIFCGCAGLINVTIPSTVTSIGGFAFLRCFSLEQFIVHDNNQNYKSVDGVLFDKTETSLMQFPSNKKDETYVISDSVTSISSYAFAFNKNIAHVIISKNVVSIGNFVFIQTPHLTCIEVVPDNKHFKTVDGVLYNYDCTDLIQYPVWISNDTFIIPDSVKTIRKNAFRNATHLIHVTIPDGVASISDEAFRFCSSLEEIIIPETVEQIGIRAFDRCPNLTSVFYMGSVNIDSELVFTDQLQNLCVSPEYKSNSFCNVSVTSNTTVCRDFRSHFNHCFKPKYVDGTFVNDKRMNASEWEEHSNSCIEYHCNNDVGRMAWSLCNSTEKAEYICVENQCVENNTPVRKRWSVDIEVDGVNPNAVNTEEILESFELDAADMRMAFVTNKNGVIVRFIIFVDDEAMASEIESRVMQCLQDHTSESL